MRVLLVMVVVLVAAGQAWGKSIKIAVLPVDLDADASEEVPKLVDDIILAAVQQLGAYEVIGQDDINTLLGFEQQKAMVGCDDATCMAQIGGALGVDKLVSIRVARLQTDWVTTGKIIDIQSARVEQRITQFTSGMAKDLLQALPGIVGLLFGREAPAPQATHSAEHSAPIAPRVEVAPAPADPEPTYPEATYAAPTEPAPYSAPDPSEPASSPVGESASGHVDDEGAGSVLGSAEIPEFIVGLHVAAGLGTTNGTTGYGGLVTMELWLWEYFGLGLLMDLELSAPPGQCVTPSGDACRDDMWFAGAVTATGGIGLFDFIKLLVRLGVGVSTLVESELISVSGVSPDPNLYLLVQGGATVWFTESLGVGATVGYTRWTTSLGSDVGPVFDLAVDELRLTASVEFGF